MNAEVSSCREVSDSTSPQRVVFVHNDLLMFLCSKIPNVENRANLVYSLIKSYNLLPSMNVMDVTPASIDDLCRFHSPLYIEFLKKISHYYSNVSEKDRELVADEFEEESKDFGIGYDCPLVSNIFSLVSLIGGSSLTGAKELCKRSADIAINWYGGWHHAQRDNAEGFCYVNDVVLAIEELRLVFDRVLYIDLDIHHGNGVENAYNFSRKVFTVSFHKYESGFYPGSGDVHDIGIGNGKYYTVNVPLKEGMSDDSYCYAFQRIISEVMKFYQPNVIVMQCGADGLTGDKLGGFNLTLRSYVFCVKQILRLRKPLLLLGGGGYNKANVARCWTYLTSVVVGRIISNNIPDNEYFSEFGPDFTLEVDASNRKNTNSAEFIETILNEIIDGVRNNVKIN